MKENQILTWIKTSTFTKGNYQWKILFWHKREFQRVGQNKQKIQSKAQVSEEYKALKKSLNLTLCGSNQLKIAPANIEL